MFSTDKAKKKSPVFWSCHLQNRCGDAFFFSTGKYGHTCTRRDQISHVQSTVAKRGLTNRANVHTPMWKSRLKHSAAEFQLIQQFWLQLDIVSSKKNLKENYKCRHAGLRRCTRKPETGEFFWGANVTRSWENNFYYFFFPATFWNLK